MSLRRNRFFIFLCSVVLKTLCFTLRFRVKDEAGLGKDDAPPVIWTLWHNRLVVIPWVRLRYFPKRSGAVLVSPSDDGELIAGTMRHFRIDAARGSSSKRPAAALKSLIRWIEDGCDVAVTPDGPRGPRYRLSPGVVKLAQATGTRIMPISVEYSRSVRLKSWDGFFVPLPFSKVEVTFAPPIAARETATAEEFEAERERIEKHMIDLTVEK